MSTPSREPEPTDLTELRAEIDKVGRRVIRHVEPGASALVVAIGMFLLLAIALLPWTRNISGWQVILGLASGATPVGVLPSLFAAVSILFGVVVTGIALVTCLWILTWLAAIGCAFSTVIGLLAIWSLQSSASHQPGPGPGPGLICSVLIMLVLATTWFRLAMSRR